jgi:hypothetical protein
MIIIPSPVPSGCLYIMRKMIIMNLRHFIRVLALYIHVLYLMFKTNIPCLCLNFGSLSFSLGWVTNHPGKITPPMKTKGSVNYAQRYESHSPESTL